MELRERVFVALNSAVENGHDMNGDAAIIAADLIGSPRFEDLTDDEQVDLQDYIREWQESFLT
jgi:hypothetical protein